MDFHPGLLPRASGNSTPQTPKHPKGLSTMSTANSLQEKRLEKAKDLKFKMNPLLVNANSETPKS